ncbi:MAG: ATP-binding cassette domain-containing protein, partial [Xanthobacteraceae bacterium]
MNKYSETDRAWVDLSVRVALDGATGPFDLAIDLTVAKGQFVVLVGPSGAGKTTLLRLIAGLMMPDRGSVRVGGAPWC